MVKSLSVQGISELYAFRQSFINQCLDKHFGDWSKRSIGKVKRSAGRQADSDNLDISFKKIELELINPGTNVLGSSFTLDVYLHLKGVSGQVQLDGDASSLTDADWPLRGVITLAKANSDGADQGGEYGTSWTLRLSNAATKEHFLDNFDRDSTGFKLPKSKRNLLYDLLIIRGDGSLWDKLASYINLRPILPVNCGGTFSTIRFGPVDGSSDHELLIITPSTPQGVGAISGGPWANDTPTYYAEYPNVAATIANNARSVDQMVHDYRGSFLAEDGWHFLRFFNKDFITWKNIDHTTTLDWGPAELGGYQGDVKTVQGADLNGRFQFTIGLKFETTPEARQIRDNLASLPAGRSSWFRYTLRWSINGEARVQPRDHLTWSIDHPLDVDFVTVIATVADHSVLKFSPWHSPWRVFWNCRREDGQGHETYRSVSNSDGLSMDQFRLGALDLFRAELWHNKISKAFPALEFPLRPSVNWTCSILSNDNPLVGIALVPKETWLLERKD